MRLSSFVVLCFLLLLCPNPAQAQTYSATSSSIAYVYTGGAYVLQMQSEWFYGPSGGAYQWSGGSVSFDLTVTRYTSYANFIAGTPDSTNLVNYPCLTGNWSVGAYSPTSVRVYGFYNLTLTGGYYYSLSMLPKAGASYQSYHYGPWNWFVWPGTNQTLILDLLNPGDD